MIIEMKDLRRKAIVDIGSNSMRLVIYEINGESYKKIIDEKNFSGLITEIKKNKMTDIGLSKLCYFLNYAREICRIANCNNISCFATSAMRKVENKEEIVALTTLKTGIAMEILSEEEETHYDAVSILRHLKQEKGVALDMGGGSCQIFMIEAGKMIHGQSFEIGSLYLYNKFVKGLIPTEKEIDKIKEYIKKSLSENENLKNIKYNQVYVFGGTMRAMYKLHRAMPYNKKDTWIENETEKLNILPESKEQVLKVKDINKMIDTIYQMNIDGINILCHTIPERVYTIIPGLIAIKHICRYLSINSVSLIDASVREGYLISHIKE